MWRDESVTWQVAHRPPGRLWELLGQVDAVHGFHYLLMRAVFTVGGDSLWTLRLPSVAATALAAAGVAALAHRLAGDRPERAALIAGLGYAALPPVQMYAQEGRSYALVAAAVVWATYLMLRERWVAYAVVLLLGCWLHEFAVLALPAHAFAAWRSRGWRLAGGAVVAGLLPLALVSARQAQQQLGWLGRPSWQDWAAYGVLAAASLLLARGAPRELVRVALPLALLPPGLLLTVSLVHPWYVDRYVLYALSGLAVLAGARLAEVRSGAVRRGAARSGAVRGGSVTGRPVTGGAVRGDADPDGSVPGGAVRGGASAGARGGWWPWLLVGALLVPLGFWSAWLRTPESRKDDALAVAATVRALARPGDAVLFLPSRRRAWLLSSPEVYGSLRDLALSRTPEASRSLQGVERTPEGIREALLDPGTDRVVALLDPAGQPLDGDPAEAVKRQTLVSSFDLCSVTEVRGARVALFARPGGCP